MNLVINVLEYKFQLNVILIIGFFAISGILSAPVETNSNNNQIVRYEVTQTENGSKFL